MARLTPQQKKQKSYERDRRNAYGENPQASRRGIRFRKRNVNRVNRHAVARPLRAPAESSEDLSEIEDAVQGRRTVRWHKRPDIALGDYLRLRAEIRRRRESHKARRDVR